MLIPQDLILSLIQPGIPAPSATGMIWEFISALSRLLGTLVSKLACLSPYGMWPVLLIVCLAYDLWDVSLAPQRSFLLKGKIYFHTFTLVSIFSIWTKSQLWRPFWLPYNPPSRVPLIPYRDSSANYSSLPRGARLCLKYPFLCPPIGRYLENLRPTFQYSSVEAF